MQSPVRETAEMMKGRVKILSEESFDIGNLRVSISKVIKICPYCSPAVPQPIEQLLISMGSSFPKYHCPQCSTEYYHYKDETAIMIPELSLDHHIQDTL